MTQKSSVFKQLFFVSLIICSTVFSVFFGQQRSRAESFNLVWSTNFNTSLKSSEWNIYNNAPFATSQTTCFMKSNAYTQKGVLNLVVNTNTANGCSGRPYASGGLDTFTYRAQTYGKWEVRAKMPAGYGVIGYIGLFPVNGSWPPEIDFAEYIGKQPNNLFITQHYGTLSNHQQDSVSITENILLRSHLRKRLSSPSRHFSKKRLGKNPFNFQKNITAPGILDLSKVNPQTLKENELDSRNILQTKFKKGTARTTGTSYWTNAFHTYTLEWVPGELRYYIDGVLQMTQLQMFTETPNMMKLAMGTGTGDCGSQSWIGCPNETATNGNPWPLPTQMQVDYVKIYNYIP